MQLYIQKQLSHIVCNLSNFSQHCSKSGNQGDLKTPIEDISLTYKLISPMQLGNFFGKRESVYVTKSPTKIWQFTSA